MSKGVYNREVVKMPQKLATKVVNELSDLRKKNKLFAERNESLIDENQSLKSSLQEKIQESNDLRVCLDEKKDKDKDTLVSVNIEITDYTGRILHQGEISVQTESENFMLNVGRGGVVQTTLSKV